MGRGRGKIIRPSTQRIAWKKTSKNAKTFDNIVSKLRKAGYNDYEVAGIIGNFIQESGYNFNMFTPGRKGFAHMDAALYDKMKNVYKDELDYYIDWGTGRINKKYKDDLGYRQGVYKPGTYKDVESATNQFLSQFERPIIKDAKGNVIGYQNSKERLAFANDVYNQLLYDHIDNSYNTMLKQRIEDMKTEPTDAIPSRPNIQMPIMAYDDPNIPNTIEATGALPKKRVLIPKPEIPDLIQPLTPPPFEPENPIGTEGFDEGKSPNKYTAKKGDSLWRISRRYTGRGARYKELLQVNDIKNPNFIRIGQDIIIPEAWMKPVKKEKEQEQKQLKKEASAVNKIEKPTIDNKSKGSVKYNKDSDSYQVITDDGLNAYNINRNALDTKQVDVELPELVVTGNKNKVKAREEVPASIARPQRGIQPPVFKKKPEYVPEPTVGNDDTYQYQMYSQPEGIPVLDYNTRSSMSRSWNKPTKPNAGVSPYEVGHQQPPSSAPYGKGEPGRYQLDEQAFQDALGEDLGTGLHAILSGDFDKASQMARTAYARKVDNAEEKASETLDYGKVTPAKKINKPVVKKEKPVEPEVLNESIRDINKESDTEYKWKNDVGVVDHTKNKFYKKRSIRITDDMKFGTRARGEYSDLPSNDAMIALLDNDGEKGQNKHKFYSYDEVIKKGIPNWGKYMNQKEFIGVGQDGTLKLGDISKFKKGDKMKVISYIDVGDIPKDKNGNYIYKTAVGNASRSSLQVTSDGKVAGLLTARRSSTGGKANGSYYNNVAGGTMLLKCGSETRLVSGSIDDIIATHNIMRQNHKGKTVRWYNVDNGSYNRGLRTKVGNIKARDLQDYDGQNTGGGNFIYRRN